MSGRPAPLIILTRPQGKNAALVTALRARGGTVLELPALQLQPSPVVPDQLPRPDHFDLLIFVSTMALSAYESALGYSTESSLTQSSSLRPRFVAGVGGATASALRQSPRFAQCHVLVPQQGQSCDSEALWPYIQRHLGDIQTALVVRGQTGREWLGHQLEVAGVSVTRFASYQRSGAIWQQSQVKLLRDSLAVSSMPPVWLMTSSEGVDAIFDQLARNDLLDGLRDARFVVVHERISRHLKTKYAEYFPGIAEPAVTLCEPESAAMCQSLVSTAFL